MKKLNFTDIVHNAFTAERYRVKDYVHVKPRYKRDALGRFTGGLARKGYSRCIYDKKAPKVTGAQLMAENIAANNALLIKLKEKGAVK